MDQEKYGQSVIHHPGLPFSTGSIHAANRQDNQVNKIKKTYQEAL